MFTSAPPNELYSTATCTSPAPGAAMSASTTVILRFIAERGDERFADAGHAGPPDR